jgi:hypothetical protein
LAEQVIVTCSANHTCGALSVDTSPHPRFILAITCLSVMSAKYSCSSVSGMVSHINLKWTELHLRPLKGVVPPFPVIPEQAVPRGGRAVQVPPVQVGVATGPVPPRALEQCGTRCDSIVVIIAVPGGEPLTGTTCQTVTWNYTIVHTR